MACGERRAARSSAHASIWPFPPCAMSSSVGKFAPGGGFVRRSSIPQQQTSHRIPVRGSGHHSRRPSRRGFSRRMPRPAIGPAHTLDTLPLLWYFSSINATPPRAASTLNNHISAPNTPSTPACNRWTGSVETARNHQHLAVFAAHLAIRCHFLAVSCRFCHP